MQNMQSVHFLVSVKHQNRIIVSLIMWYRNQGKMCLLYFLPYILQKESKDRTSLSQVSYRIAAVKSSLKLWLKNEFFAGSFLWSFQNFSEKLFYRICPGDYQKQPFLYILQKKRFWKTGKIHKKAPVLESLCNKAAGWKPATLSNRILRQRCFPVNLAKFLRTPSFIKYLR